MSKSVIVVGAGIIGATVSLRLAQDGYAVTLCDADEPGSPGAASYGNGGWISPASIIPMSMPGLWRKVPGYLLDRDGPLTIDAGSLLRLTPWLVRFLLAGWTRERARRTARALSWLIGDAPQRHAALAEATDQEALIVRKGLLYAYPDRAAFEAEAFSWALRRENGVAFEEWDERTLRERLPALGETYRFAIHVTQGTHCLNTGRYVAGIAQTAQSLGAVFHRRAVSQILGGRDPRVVLEGGRSLAADHIVVAAGIRSERMMRELGIRVPLASERGYHVTVGAPDTPFDIPVMPSTGKMANTPTEMGLRLSGQVELAAIDKAPDWRRADILRRHAWESYPYLARSNPSDLSFWMGHRPSTPDGLPVIGAFAREPGIIAAFGHGHIGIAAAPMTAACVVDAIRGEVKEGARPFGPARFGA